MEKRKTITIKKTTWKALADFKLNEDKQSFDEVILYFLKKENGTI